MLVLSRTRNQTIMIGDVCVTIVDVRGEKVRVGIEAPKDVPVHRLEVYESIQRERFAASVDAGAIEVVVPIVSKVENAEIQVPMPIKPELKWGSNVQDEN